MPSALYKKEFDQMLIEHMSQGYSFESFGAIAGCGRRTLFDWCDQHPSFKEAKYEGHEKAKRMFESILIAKARGKEISGIDLKKSDTACLIFALKTRFKESYSEKVEIESSGAISIVIDKDDAQL